MDNGYKDMGLFDFTVLTVKKLGALLAWLLRGLHSVIAIGWKRWYIVLAGVVLGFAFARFVWVKPEFTRFTGEATIVFPEGMKQTVEEGLACFDNESGENKCDMFGIPYDVQRRFRGMTWFNNVDAKCDSTVDFVDFKGKADAEDSIYRIVPNRLTVRIKMVGADGFWNYENAMRLYFNQREEYAAPAARWREMMERRIEAVDREIARTDSFVDREYFEGEVRVTMPGEMTIAPMKLRAEEVMKLRREREYLVEQLAMTPEVVNFQTHFHCSAMLIRDKYIYSVLVGLALALIVALGIEFRKNINRYLHP